MELKEYLNKVKQRLLTVSSQKWKPLLFYSVLTTPIILSSVLFSCDKATYPLEAECTLYKDEHLSNETHTIRNLNQLVPVGLVKLRKENRFSPVKLSGMVSSNILPPSHSSPIKLSIHEKAEISFERGCSDVGRSISHMILSEANQKSSESMRYLENPSATFPLVGSNAVIGRPLVLKITENGEETSLCCGVIGLSAGASSSTPL
eukprot:TRINITY_DN846_c0_g1_i1.p1 TRINITY_DN846_c0_g1~~TRINITY_DN846_c0_g1_i1.p1  ORF type:complete len:222 (+),score=36.98 TRINITY_DN846_c0_g1_i1:54-668(+)